MATGRILTGRPPSLYKITFHMESRPILHGHVFGLMEPIKAEWRLWTKFSNMWQHMGGVYWEKQMFEALVQEHLQSS